MSALASPLAANCRTGAAVASNPSVHFPPIADLIRFGDVCRMTTEEDAVRYYRGMLNALAGLEDDLDANSALEEAKDLLRELIETCRSDFRSRFQLDG